MRMDEGMNIAVRRGPSPGSRMPVLVYRDRIAPLSEAHFLRRQYLGFERLSPVWVGCRTDVGLPELGVQPLIVGRPGLAGIWDRILFRQFGVLPPVPDLRALHPGIVHAQFGRGGTLALPIARALGVPLVVTFHGGDATKQRHHRRLGLPTIFRRRMGALKREAALFVCVSQFVRDRLEVLGFPAAKLRVIRLGVELQPLVEAPQPVEPPQVVFVGRFIEKKGIPHLIEAARLLAAKGRPVGVTLVGDGPQAGALKQQARGIPGITFTGWLPSHEVRRHVRGALALCVPSVVSRDGDTDGLPTVILEAMAEGVPVIGSRQAGIAEAVDDRATGLLVPPGDAQALAAAIETLVASPEQRRDMGLAARRAVEERFNAISQSRLLEQTLMEITEKERT